MVRGHLGFLIVGLHKVNSSLKKIGFMSNKPEVDLDIGQFEMVVVG